MTSFAHTPRAIALLAGILYFVLLPPTAGALDAAGVLDATQVARLSEAHNPEVRAALARVASARHASGLAEESPHRTNVSVEGGPTFGFGGHVGGEVTLSASRPIELGDKAAHRVAVAMADILEAEATLDEVRLRVRVEAIGVFASWLAAADRARGADETALLAQSVGASITQRLAAGMATRFDAQAAALTIARARLEASQAQREVEILGTELQLLLGLGARPVAHLDYPTPSFPDLTTVIDRATATHGRVKAALAGVDAMRTRVRLAEANAEGDIAIGGFTTVADDSALVGISVSWDLPTRDRSAKEVAALTSGVDAAEANVELVTRDLVRVLSSLWHRANGHREHARQLSADVEPVLESTRLLLTSAIDQGTATGAQLLGLLQERRALANARIEADVNARSAIMLLLAMSGAE
ncbi:MAG: TolC family protein [Myxococcales bacterium]|nr:TolC family protein [Myxococcales bacterium]